jgi:hypothetical protein
MGFKKGSKVMDGPKSQIGGVFYDIPIMKICMSMIAMK